MKTDGPFVPPAGGDALLPPGAADALLPPGAGARLGTEDAAPGRSPHGGLEPGPWHADVPMPFRGAFALRDLRNAGLAAVVVAVLGVPVGLLWAALGPRAPILVTADGAVSAENAPEAFIGADGTFGALGIGAGFVIGAALYLWRRGRGPWMAIGLAVGSLAGAFLASKVGHLVGLGAYQELLAAEPTGRVVERPVGLRAHGMLFLQPLVAVVVYVLAAGWSRFGDLGRIVPEEPPVSSG